MKQIGILFCLLIYLIPAWTQSHSFDISIQPLNWTLPTGLQSFAVGQWEGKWLLVGGRLDGLHRRQPFATFDREGRNTRLWIVDPANGKTWSYATDEFPGQLGDQLSATNMEFLQSGPYLYLAGGYGYSTSAADHITFGSLTAIDLPVVMRAIIGNMSPLPGLRQIQRPEFAITGGQWETLDGWHYIVGGQRFTGRYNPHGPDHGPGFEQQYTDAALYFKMEDDGKAIEIKDLGYLRDSVLLHKRDFNAAAQIMPDGRQAITAFSGVFQYQYDIPFLTAVHISPAGLTPEPDFAQYYNHYHCPTLPVFDSDRREMHTIFFGGIAQYYDSAGMLTQNNNVPFVRTVARVTRDREGNMTEYKMPVEMPALLGSGAEFIPHDAHFHYTNGVLQWNSLSQDTITVGYIAGGIESTGPNIFWVNEGDLSSAGSGVFRIDIIRSRGSMDHQINPQSKGTLRMQILPSPFLHPDSFEYRFHLQHPGDVRVIVKNENGKVINRFRTKSLSAGVHIMKQEIPSPEIGGVFFLTLCIAGEEATQKVVIEP